MPDDLLSDTAPPPQPAALVPPPRRSGGGLIALGFAVAFLLGAAGVAWVAWQGLIPLPRPAAQNLAPPAAAPSPAPAAAAASAAAPGTIAAQQDQLEARVAALSARLDALTLQAQAAAGNTGRAEALLVVVAARRALDRGAPLNTLEDQLRLRFGGTQPNAVATVIAAAGNPVTLDQLVAGLDSLAPSLTRAPEETSAWSRLRAELAALFVIRREATPSPAPRTLLDHARILLEAGRTDDAIAEVRRLPGASGAADWFTAARRYDDARRALDVLETAALIGQPARSGVAVSGSPGQPSTGAAGSAGAGI